MHLASRQNKKYCKQLHVALQNIFFRELDDPIFRRICINYLKLNTKKTLATVYLDVENIDICKNVFVKLEQLTAFFRKRLSEELSVFKVPYLKFEKDEVLHQAMRVEHLISEDLKKDV